MYYVNLVLIEMFRMPDKVLKPEDFNQRNPGRGWRPQVGMSRNSMYRGKDMGAANRMIR